MRERRPLLEVLMAFTLQLVLLAAGVGLAIAGRVFGMGVLTGIGLAVAAVTIVWIFVSCIRHGIDPLDV